MPQADAVGRDCPCVGLPYAPPPPLSGAGSRRSGLSVRGAAPPPLGRLKAIRVGTVRAWGCQNRVRGPFPLNRRDCPCVGLPAPDNAVVTCVKSGLSVRGAAVRNAADGWSVAVGTVRAWGCQKGYRGNRADASRDCPCVGLPYHNVPAGAGRRSGLSVRGAAPTYGSLRWFHARTGPIRLGHYD